MVPHVMMKDTTSTMVPHVMMKDITSTMSRQHPAAILSIKEPTPNVPIRQVMKPVKLTRKKSPSPVKLEFRKNQASDTKEKKYIVQGDDIVEQRKEDNAEEDTKLSSQPVSSSNILLIQRNKNSFRTTGPNLEVMRTVTKPVILPMVSPGTATSIKRKVLTPIVSGQTKKILLTSNKQMPGTNFPNQDKANHAVNNIQMGHFKKAVILQSKDSMETIEKGQPLQSIDRKSDPGEPINLSLKAYYKWNTAKPVSIALAQNNKLEGKMAKPHDNNLYTRTNKTSLHQNTDFPKIEKVYCLSKLQEQEKPSLLDGAKDTSSKLYNSLTEKVLSRFIPHTRQTFSSPNSIESVMTPSESMLQHTVSITPIRRCMELFEDSVSDESDDDFEHCHICKQNFAPEVFLAHINSCIEAKGSDCDEECNNCGKYYSDQVKLDRHKCDGYMEVSKRISQFALNEKSQNNPDIHFQVDVKQEMMEEDPLGIGEESLGQTGDGDIDDDEESYLQKIGEDMANLVQVKLECSLDENDSIILDEEEIAISENKRICPSCQSTVDTSQYQEHLQSCAKKTFTCPKCPRTYAKKQLCDLHMKKAHNLAKFKEKCEICGVRFINLQAHKEKYHYFVDVDKCSLCGKVVKYLSSHHCPLQEETAAKESKMDCPNCGNLVKQKYLKIHQKNHCVGIRTSTFTNFRTATQDQNTAGRIPLQITPKFVPTEEQAGNEKTSKDQEIKEKTSFGQKGVHLIPR